LADALAKLSGDSPITSITFWVMLISSEKSQYTKVR
jgi:hypothetical protein